VDFVEKWLRGSDKEVTPHLLLVGRTGSGKTSAARAILSCALREGLYDVTILDWDAEYAGLVPLEVHEPPFEIAAPPAVVADALAEVERMEGSGHGVAFFLRKAMAAGANFGKAAEKLRTSLEVTSYALRAALEAAIVRLETLAPYINFGVGAPEENCGLREGIYLLSEIFSIWDRSAVRQFLAMYHVAARRRAAILAERDPSHAPPLPSILVIEEGSVGAHSTYLKHLAVEARTARVKVVLISQEPPPPEIHQNFEILLFDTNWQIRRQLRAPIPDGTLQPGECWWVRRGSAPKKLKFRVEQ
jgi:DNA polymerase III delta prime subunit